LTSVLKICQVSVSFIGEQRKYLLATLQCSDVGLNGAHGRNFAMTARPRKWGYRHVSGRLCQLQAGSLFLATTTQGRSGGA
jgi:hypothetical protein